MKAVQMQDGFGGNLSKNEAGILPAIANKMTDESIWTDKTKYDNQEATMAKKMVDGGMRQDLAKQKAHKLMKDVAKFKGKTVPAEATPSLQPAQNNQQQSRPTQNRPAQNNQQQSRPTQNRPAQNNQQQSRPAQNRPAQNNQQQSRPTQNRPASSNPPTNNPTNSTPV